MSFSRIKVNAAAEMSQGAVEWGAVEWELAPCGVLLLPKVPFQDQGLLTNQVTAFMGPVMLAPLALRPHGN